MLHHDYTEEALYYLAANMSDEEITADIREMLKDNDFDDCTINEYINNLLFVVQEMREEKEKECEAIAKMSETIINYLE